MGGGMPDTPQLFIAKVDSTSEKHHTAITIDSGDLVVTYSLPIHQHHVEISNTCHTWVWWLWYPYWVHDPTEGHKADRGVSRAYR